MPEAASTFVTLIPTTRGFGAAISRQIGGDLDQAGKEGGRRFGGGMAVGLASMAKGIFGPLAAAAAAVTIGDFFSGAVGEARESQKVGSLTRQVIKTTGGAAKVTAEQVEDLSTALSNKTGMDDEAIQSGANLLLTFKNVRNEIGTGNQVFDRATQAAADLSAAGFGPLSGTSKQLGKALNDPIGGMTALGRAGVTFTDQQKEQIKTLVKSGDVLGAQKIILGEVESQVGGAAEASATAGEKFATAFGNFQETVGELLIPALDKTLNLGSRVAIFLSTNLGPAIDTVGRFIKPAADAIAGFFDSGGTGPSRFAPLVGFLRDQLIPAFRGIWTAVRGLVDTVWPIVQQFVAGMVERFRPLMPTVRAIFEQVGSIITGTMAVVRAVIQTVTAAVQFIWTRWGAQIMNTVTVVFRAVLNIIRPALGIVQGIIKTVLSVIRGDWSGAWVGIRKVLSSSWDLIKAVVRGALEVVKAAIRLALSVIKTLWSAAWNGLVSFLGTAWTKIKTGVSDGITSAVNKIKELPGRLVSGLGNLGGLLVRAGSELIAGLIRGITGQFDALKRKMGEIAQTIKDFLPGSPVKTGPLTSWNNGGAGKRLVGLLADGLSETGPVEDAAAKLAASIGTPRIGLAPAYAGPAGGPSPVGRGDQHLHVNGNVVDVQWLFDEWDRRRRLFEAAHPSFAG